jgi:hypothetical protein
LSVGDPLDWWRVEEVLPGHLYWWAIKPFHGLVFGGMQRNIATAAEGSGPPQWKPSRKSS